ncbi:Hypothetical protein R9X50_00101100 [Acrodontium crateriforme]|uniref:Uncharacterized protein n=1 Tax=Acrodontium crateriforme TaxID=150365 RepID=A0AAQ3LYL1_9PEZI|nr:Hypothetical protein R9X50_00101100 [Acrodontium crateriforme]
MNNASYLKMERQGVESASTDSIADFSTSKELYKCYEDRDLRRSSIWQACGPLVPVIVVLLAVSNVFLLMTDHLAGTKSAQVILGQNSNYYGSPQFVMTEFNHDWTNLVGEEREGYRYKDEEWDSFFPHGGGAVALSSAFVDRYGVPRNAAPTPEDPSKGIYMIAGYHQMHCLSIVRDALYWLNGTLAKWPDNNGFMWDHVLHCVEAVRQGLTCNMDPTLINLNETWPGIPNGQKHECRNLDAMRKFADANWHELPTPGGA